MIRSRRALLVSSALVAAVSFVGGVSIALAVVVGWYLATAPGAAACRLLRVPTERASGWLTVLAASFSIDTVTTEVMLYARVWTPARGLATIAAVTALLVAIERQLLNKRSEKLR
jgi:hypothetical protein